MQYLSDQCCKDSSLFNVNLNMLLQRGPRYKAYAELRESKLRNRMIQQQQQQQRLQDNKLESEQLFSPPPPIKERAVVIQSSPVSASGRNGGRSIVGRSVPNFSAVLRKENRKPVSPVAAETKTPPLKGRAVSKLGSGLGGGGGGGGGGGSKSANGCTEKRGVMMARRSCANIEELQTLSFGVSSAINGVGRGGGGGRVVSGGVDNRAVLGSRLYGL
ncbi:hypothetical protein BVC80_7247g2 [Macleaya cordata]|uniref:Uncharacterized protein n=1 Tax=Macleaya cordata TaxID=56857 RepID=A0A200R0W3_MACCD|nr:hypothetical protein BVC80_7247g2 [Macleaya cordata]